MRPKVTFGIIVLNGEPFTRYCLRALYPFAHQIIVVEGAAARIPGIATADGHSLDETLDVVRAFCRDEDPEKKVTLVTAEDEGHPDGHWPGEKDAMSQAYFDRATGDYVWQVDIDEFYHPEHMEHVLARLATGDADGASFKMLTFWGGFDWVTDSLYLRRGAAIYHRLFRWKPGYRFAGHRPPTVLDESGVSLRKRSGWLDAKSLFADGIVLQHYSLVFPKQVQEKCRYYAGSAWARRKNALRWCERAFLRLDSPFRVHNVYQSIGWLERYEGSHPPQIERLRKDLALGIVHCAQRPSDDVERLLRRPFYRWGSAILRQLFPQRY